MPSYPSPSPSRNPGIFHHPLKRAARALGARCDICPVRDTGIPVGSVGPSPAKAKLVIVGEGPGGHEERTGVPFIGRSGKLLDQLLKNEARISRSDCHINNAALCRSHDRDEDNDTAGECCAPRLHAELARTPKSTPIAALGGGAAASILGTEGIKLIRGFVWRASEVAEKEIKALERKVLKQEPGTPTRALAELRASTLHGRLALSGCLVLPTLHPVYVLKNEMGHPIIRLDFRRIGRAARRELGPDDAAGKFEVFPPIPNGRLQKALWALPSVVSLDVETTDSGSALTARLICVGVGWRGNVVIVWPWHSRVAGMLQRFLRSRREVVGHNMIAFDRVVLERHGIT